jgi:hypothetical protein
MTCTRHDAKCGVGQRSLEKEAWFETRRILVADKKKSRRVEVAQGLSEVPE